jgi:hypothetical protein
MATINEIEKMEQKVNPNDPDVRWSKVKWVLEALAAGTYPLDERLESVADSLATQMSS